MDNKRHYRKLIINALNRTNLNEYYELHHIVPRCLGGSDDDTNLVKLTVREHFIAHQLLYRIHKHENRNLIHAVFAFFEDANEHRHVLRNRPIWMHRWLRRERSIATHLTIRDMGYQKVAKWNQMREAEKREYLKNLGED